MWGLASTPGAGTVTFLMMLQSRFIFCNSWVQGGWQVCPPCAGAVTFLMMLLSRFIFRKYGWGVAALITPTVLLITGVAFFVLVLFSGARGA